jgi:hypothetical protein
MPLGLKIRVNSILRPSGTGGGGDGPPSASYLRPDGTSYFLRPDGASYYLRP